MSAIKVGDWVRVKGKQACIKACLATEDDNDDTFGYSEQYMSGVYDSLHLNTYKVSEVDFTDNSINILLRDCRVACWISTTSVIKVLSATMEGGGI